MRGSSLLRLLLLGLVAGLIAVAAGCGGSSDDSASDDEPAVTETSDESTDETTDETTEESTEDEESTDESDSEATDLSDVASADDCRDLGELSAALGEALGGADVDVDRYATFLEEFADRTPEEIRDDFQVLASAWAIYAEVLGDFDLAAGEIPSAEDLAGLQQAFEEIDQEEIAEASENIGNWVQENCTP